jgi:hypothetical protein
MNRALIDENLRSKLSEFHVQTELCDKDGHVLGHFTPAIPSDREIYDWAAAQISDEELERRKNEPGGKTTAQLLEYLQSL